MKLIWQRNLTFNILIWQRNLILYTLIWHCKYWMFFILLYLFICKQQGLTSVWTWTWTREFKGTWTWELNKSSKWSCLKSLIVKMIYKKFLQNLKCVAQEMSDLIISFNLVFDWEGPQTLIKIYDFHLSLFFVIKRK